VAEREGKTVKVGWDDDLNVRNQIHCNYVLGLGHLGLGNKAKAQAFLTKVQEMDVNHQGSQVHLISIFPKPPSLH